MGTALCIYKHTHTVYLYKYACIYLYYHLKYVHVFIYAALKGCFADAHSFRFIRAEEAGVVALLHDYVGDARLVVLLQLDAGVSDGQQLVVQDLHKDDIYDATKDFYFK